MEYRNFSARVSGANTPESDAQEMVMHIVSYDAVAPDLGRGESTSPKTIYRERKTMEVLARDPMDAIDYARKILNERA